MILALTKEHGRIIDQLRKHVPGAWRYEWPSRWVHESGLVVQRFACLDGGDDDTFRTEMRRLDTGALVHPYTGLGLKEVKR